MAKEPTKQTEPTKEDQAPPAEPEKKKTPMEERRDLLVARLNGPNLHSYPAETIRTWRIELARIQNKTWKGPLKIKQQNKVYEEIVGSGS